MSDRFQCGDNTALVGYLYGECEAEERGVIAAHVSICAACAVELAALDSTREQLASWTPPDIERGLALGGRPQVSGLRPQEASGVRPAGAWPPSPGAFATFRGPLPAWAQAAAACLIFAAGLWLGVMRGSAPATTSAGTSAEGTATAPTPARIADGPLRTMASATAVATATDLAALERRLRAEMAQLRSAALTQAAGAQGAAGGQGAVNNADGQLLARVRTLIEESEQRQQRELALRTAQVVRDFDLQRQMDLAQIQNTVGQIEGLTGAEVRDQRQMLNYLMRVSEQR
jgi:hypothetical protein